MDFLQAGVTRARVDRAVRSSWLAAVHESLRATGGAVTAPVEDPAAGRNYYRAAGTPVTLLLNAAAGLVAAAGPATDAHELAVTFADVPHGEVFERAGFRVATAADLNQPLREQHLRSLTEDEQRDVAYHQPARIGDLPFNWFD